MDGMIEHYDFNGNSLGRRPGKVLQLMLDLRKSVGTLVKRKKEGMRFEVRDAEELVDKIRDRANELGLLIYPIEARGKGHVVEDGTLAEVDLTVVLQAVEDGSRLAIAGFGLGADTQDKAGGKAGTYAFKSALVQAMLAQGKGRVKVPDTDDTDTPIAGGVKPKRGANRPSVDAVKTAFQTAADEPQYRAAVAEIMKLKPEDQVALKDVTYAAKERLGINKAPAA